MPENREQKAARRYRHGSEEYRGMQRENLRELSSDMKKRAMSPGRSVVDAAKRAKKAMGMAAGGEPKAMVRKEISFMQRKGAPKSMIEHEKREAKGMRKGGKCYAGGGLVGKASSRADGIASKGKTKCKMV